jgi:hypothetical protein
VRAYLLREHTHTTATVTTNGEKIGLPAKHTVSGNDMERSGRNRAANGRH